MGPFSVALLSTTPIPIRRGSPETVIEFWNPDRTTSLFFWTTGRLLFDVLGKSLQSIIDQTSQPRT
jgi:hypothetical protein